MDTEIKLVLITIDDGNRLKDVDIPIKAEDFNETADPWTAFWSDAHPDFFTIKDFNNDYHVIPLAKIVYFQVSNHAVNIEDIEGMDEEDDGDSWKKPKGLR